MNSNFPVATPINFSIFDSFGMKSLNLVLISSVASKWQVFKVRMLVFQPLYEVKLKVSF